LQVDYLQKERKIKMKLKAISICFVLLFMLVLCGNVYAVTSVIDVNIYNEEYVQSKNENIESIYSNTIDSAVVYDVDVLHSGFTYSSSTIDIRPGVYMKGVQLFVSADTLRIDGEVENIAAYSQNVVISGRVKGDVAIYANSVYIKDGAVIEGDVLIYTPVLEVAGTVQGNLLAKAATSAKITGTVNGQVKLITTALSMENETLTGNIYVETNTDYAEFEKNIVTIGVGDYAEIWSEAVYDKMTANLSASDVENILIELGM
jgi:cytoskeletal protein CcmA (bactofilin family)